MLRLDGVRDMVTLQSQRLRRTAHIMGTSLPPPSFHFTSSLFQFSLPVSRPPPPRHTLRATPVCAAAAAAAAPAAAPAPAPAVTVAPLDPSSRLMAPTKVSQGRARPRSASPAVSSSRVRSSMGGGGFGGPGGPGPGTFVLIYLLFDSFFFLSLFFFFFSLVSIHRSISLFRVCLLLFAALLISLHVCFFWLKRCG